MNSHTSETAILPLWTASVVLAPAVLQPGVVGEDEPGVVRLNLPRQVLDR